MKKIGIAISSLCLVLALGAGCKKKDGDKAAGGGAVPTNMSADQACDKVIAMMGDMGKAVEGAGEDCDKMGTALQKWADDNKAFMEWAKTQDKDPAKKKEFEDKCKSKMDPVMEKMGPMMAGAAKCAENPKVKAAMSQMGD